MATHDDRDRLLNRPRVRVDAGEVDEGAVMLRRRAYQSARAHRGTRRWRPALAVGQRDGRELDELVARTATETKSSVRHHVERGRLLREDDRVVMRQDDDAGAEQYPSGCAAAHDSASNESR